jgi:hypothetical protein
LHGKKGHFRFIGMGLACLCIFGCRKPSPSPHDQKAVDDASPPAMVAPEAPVAVQEKPQAPVPTPALTSVPASAAGAALNPYAAMSASELKAEVARLDMQIQSNLTVVVTNVAGVPARPSAYAQDCARDLIRKKVMAETVWRAKGGGAPGGDKR